VPRHPVHCGYKGKDGCSVLDREYTVVKRGRVTVPPTNGESRKSPLFYSGYSGGLPSVPHLLPALLCRPGSLTLQAVGGVGNSARPPQAITGTYQDWLPSLRGLRVALGGLAGHGMGASAPVQGIKILHRSRSPPMGDGTCSRTCWGTVVPCWHPLYARPSSLGGCILMGSALRSLHWSAFGPASVPCCWA